MVQNHAFSGADAGNKPGVTPVSALLVAQFRCASASAEEVLHSFGPQSLQQIKSVYAGQAFVLFLWSLECTYCRASMEALAAMQAKQSLKVVTVATDAISNRENRHHIEAKLDATGLVAQRWAFGPYPAQ